MSQLQKRTETALRGVRIAACLALLFAVPVSTQASPPVPAVTAEQIEADWNRQDAVREVVNTGENVTTAEDAAGGCDGAKTGEWGFHTGSEAQPWWQVDLGQSQPLQRMLLFNRGGVFAARNARIRFCCRTMVATFVKSTSTTAPSFSDSRTASLLSVPLDGHAARFVRLQLPATDYLHLDEVEIYAAGRDENVALHRPANQSSTSQWSVRHEVGGRSRAKDFTARTVSRGQQLAGRLQQLGVDVSAESQVLASVAARHQCRR